MVDKNSSLLRAGRSGIIIGSHKQADYTQTAAFAASANTVGANGKRPKNGSMMFRLIYERMSRVNDGYKRFMDRMTDVETFGSWLFGLTLLGTAWALAWYAHLFFPWLEHLMGFGPHDIDSVGKIRWRRIWSTAVCLPGMLFCTALYFRNLYRRSK